jgi:hypothetical protein
MLTHHSEPDMLDLLELDLCNQHCNVHYLRRFGRVHCLGRWSLERNKSHYGRAGRRRHKANRHS